MKEPGLRCRVFEVSVKPEGASEDWYMEMPERLAGTDVKVTVSTTVDTGAKWIFLGKLVALVEDLGAVTRQYDSAEQQPIDRADRIINAYTEIILEVCLDSLILPPKAPRSEFQSPSMGGRMMKIHAEVWVAAASLHDRGQKEFTTKELHDEVQRLFGDSRPGVLAYITAHANASANKAIPTVYNYVFRVGRGVNRLCRVGDQVHPSRTGSSMWPEQTDVNEGFWPLWRKWVSWQHDDGAGFTEVAATGEAMQHVTPAAPRARGDAPERLAAYVRSLPDFQMERTPATGYDHMGAIIAEAVLQAGINYQNVVLPRIDTLRKRYPQTRTTSQFAVLLQSIGTGELLSFSGKKLERVEALTRFFMEEGVETEADLREWLGRVANLTRLQSLVGVGPKTVDYLQILVGLDTSAVDRHLALFVDQAGVEATTYKGRKEIINSAAGLLGVNKAVLDYSIWLYMSTRAGATGGAARPGTQRNAQVKGQLDAGAPEVNQLQLDQEDADVVEGSDPGDAAHYLQSTYREAMLEHLLIGELMRCLWPKPLEVYKPQVDAAGWDLLLAHEGDLRYVQLKTSKVGAATSSVNVHASLWERPGSCVIWTWFDPDTTALQEFLWLGDPGQPLPSLTDLKYARHTKANAQGEKSVRPGLRVIPKTFFKRLLTVADLRQELFPGAIKGN